MPAQPQYKIPDPAHLARSDRIQIWYFDRLYEG